MKTVKTLKTRKMCMFALLATFAFFLNCNFYNEIADYYVVPLEKMFGSKSESDDRRSDVASASESVTQTEERVEHVERQSEQVDRQPERPAQQQIRASFDCAQASTAVEGAICSNAELADLDFNLAQVFRQAVSNCGDNVRDEQRAWIRQRNNCGADVACLRREYSNRISALENMRCGSRQEAVGQGQASQEVEVSGGRSMASVRRVVMQNMGAMRRAYNTRLRERPNLSGVITVRFLINESGQVTSATLVNSTIGDTQLENIILEGVRSYQFERINRPGDVTTVTYPFRFTQE